MDLSRERKLIIGFACLLAILALLGTYSFYNNKKSNESALYVQHTNEVLQHLGQIRNLLFQIEVHKSYWLMDHMEEHRTVTEKLRNEIRENLEKLTKLSADDAIQSKRIDSLERLLQQRLSLTSQLFHVKANHTPKGEVLKMELTKTYDILLLMDRFRQFERTKREKSKERHDFYINRFSFIIVCLFTLAISCIILLALLVHYHLEIRSANENKIREHWQTLQSILDNTSSYISIKDLDGRYTLVNKRLEFDSQHTKESYLGKTDTEVFSPEVGKMTRETDSKVIQEGVSLQYNSKIMVQGTPLHYFVVKFPWRDLNGTIMGVTSIATDISEQVNLEEENRKALERVYDLYNRAPCGYHSIDSNGLIVEMNDTELKWLGYERMEVINKLKYSDLVSPHHISSYSALEHKSIYQNELQLLRKDGTYLPVFLSSEPIRDENGGVVRTRTIVFDNTERKKQEDKIKQLNLDLEINNVLLKTTNSELESFTYSVSHDLRAPLRSINGYAQILKEDFSEQLDENGKKTVQIILKNAKRMGNLIDDLLAFSKMGRQELRKSKVDMQDLVESIVLDLPKHTAELRIQGLPTIKGDHNLLRQVWQNLLSNALKYSTPKSYPVVEIGYRQELMEDIFYVKDNGVGFDMQYAHKLFGVFQRLHRNDEFEGTGVGLAFVQRIVAKHGGKVWAESVPNEGAVFYFSLPRLDLTYSTA